MYLFQDWTTIAGNGTTPFVQSVLDWADFARFADAVFWLEVRAVSNPGMGGGGSVTLSYESAPAKDESLFQPIATVTLAAGSAPVVTKVRVADNPAVPLGRWVRYKLEGSEAGDWSACFRIFAVGGRATTGFSPASLPLTGWWRAPYAGVPWAGTASAGASASRDLDQPTPSFRPAVGASVNGYAPPDFDGSDDQLSVPVANDVLFSASGLSFVALFYADTTPTASGNAYADGTLLTDPSNAETTFGFTNLGASACLLPSGFGYTRINVSCSSGAWHLAQFRHDGVNLEGRVDGGSWTSTSCGTLAFLTPSSPLVGWSYGGLRFDGRLLEMMTSDEALSNETFDVLKSYVNARYALSL